MNLKKLSDKELIDLINSTHDLSLLCEAEQEYVDRHVETIPWDVDNDEIIMEQINKSWRAR